MNKKFLSAILFGVLMVTSTGTFVSCKDYDDDIENLQTQIDANKTAISELKNLVGDGNYVTSVTVSGQNLVVNTKNGSTTVALPACEGGTQAEVKNDELYIDGKATGIKVAAGEAVKVVDGDWAILQADGTYKSTNIPASGVTVIGDEKDGYILTIIDAEGEETVIELPTAASSITSLSLNNGSETTFTLDWFNFTKATAAVKKAWKEGSGREVTADSYILFSPEGKGLRVNPVTVDAKEIDFTLVNGKNETFPSIVLDAKEDKTYTNVTRAAYGNGLYTLNIKRFAIVKDNTNEANKEFYKYINVSTDSKNMGGKGYYAVAANSAIRAEYNVIVKLGNATTANLGAIYVNTTQASTAAGTKGTATVKTGVEQFITVEQPDHLYDLYLTAKSEDINIFGIEFSADKKSFTITKSPDQVTAADFVLTVHTMDNQGNVKETPITITLSEAIDVAATYETRTLAIVANKDDKSDANYFKADMATMTTALGANLDIWKRKVASETVTIYKEVTCKTSMGSAADNGIEFSYLGADGKATNSITAAADMKFYVLNTTAAEKFDVNTVYYAKVSFSNGTEVLNSIVIPFQFTVPTFASLFEVEPAVFTGDVAYAYLNVADQLAGTINTGLAAYSFSNAFKTIPTDAKFTLADDDDIIADKYNSDDLAKIGTTAYEATTANVAYAANLKIYLNNVDVDTTTGLQAGYGKELTITATDADYEGWAYAEGDDEYTFKMKIMSPIYEGTVTSIKSSVEVPVTSVEGYKMGNNDIEGKTYGAVAYKVFQDVATGWSRPEIAKVTGASENERVAKIGNDGVAYGVMTDTDGKVTAEGYLQVLPQNIENTTNVVVNLTVEDIWGYKKVSPITVTVKK